MRHKIIIITFTLCAAFTLGNSFKIEASANEKGIASGITIEYEDYKDASESIQSEFGAILHLSSIEKVGESYQAVYCENDILQESPDQSVSPHIIVSSEKKVVNTYSTFDEIPSSISYEEFNNSYNIWMSGTLYLKKAERLGSVWSATFEGTLIGVL